MQRVNRNQATGAAFTITALIFLQLPMPTAAAGQQNSFRTFKVGTVTRSFVPKEPYRWRGAQTHALITQIWYPAGATAVEQPQWIGPPSAPLFSAGAAAKDAGLAPSPARFPLILLSHGTGGSAAIVGWFGAALASCGYIVAGVNHPGNNGLEQYTPQGFNLWWERARDLSVVIDQMLEDPAFGPRIDPRRVGAAGFSLGGYTMIEVAGGITNRSAYLDFCNSAAADNMCKTPPEFQGDLFERATELAKTDQEFRESISHSADSYRDVRIRAVFAMAPALGPAFPATGLKQITIPVEIVAGASDSNVPIETSAKYFAANIPHARLTIFPGGVGHYEFLGTCTDAGRKSRPMLCTDAADVDREAIHKRTVEAAVSFFAAHLK
jgi:predicted dienelactone hydrolase